MIGEASIVVKPFYDHDLRRTCSQDAFFLVEVGALFDESQRVEVLIDSQVLKPRAILVSDLRGRHIVSHGIIYAQTVVTSDDVVALRQRTIEVERECQMVVKRSVLDEGTTREFLKVSSFHHTHVLHVVEAHVIVGLVAAAIDRKVMVVAEARSLHLVLPVDVATGVLSRGDVSVIVLHPGTVLVGIHDIVFLGHDVGSHISAVLDVRMTFLSALRRNDDDTVGSLGTIDGCGGGISQHVDALDVIG